MNTSNAPLSCRVVIVDDTATASDTFARWIDVALTDDTAARLADLASDDFDMSDDEVESFRASAI